MIPIAHPYAGRPDPASARSEVLTRGRASALARLHARARGWMLRNRPDLARARLALERARQGERRLLSLLRAATGMKALLRDARSETSSCRGHGVRRVSRVHASGPTPSRGTGATLSGRLRAGESAPRALRRQLELAGSGLDPGQLPADRVASSRSTATMARFSRRVPDGLGPNTARSPEIAEELSARACGAPLDARTRTGAAPCSATTRAWSRRDPHFRDHVMFHEYFHGDTGRGLGASTQTGSSGLVAMLIQQCATGPADRMRP